MRTDSGGYPHALEVDMKEIRIMRLKKRTAAHAPRRFKRKNGGFWRAQFCTELVLPRRIELLFSP
jgi:hypothetical protein